jgi:prepilin-type N-terminal cleavage/methylation domain-containing protein
MTLQTGKRMRRAPINNPRLRRAGQGFTLIELIIVASLILALVAVSTPFFRATFRDLELRNAAYNISKMIRYASSSAVIEEARYKLVFDFDKRAYWLMVENEKDPSAGFERAKGRFGERCYLPKEVFFAGESRELFFLPNGRCTKGSLIVTDKGRKRGFKINTTGRQGQAEVTNADKISQPQ